MQKQTVYQKDNNGKVKQWSIWVEKNLDDTATIFVEHGQQGGKLQVATTPILCGKNAGKANATTCYQQACLDAQSDLTKKLKKGYVADITQIKDSSVKGSGSPAPMLANKYDPTKKQGSSKDLKGFKLEGKEIIIQCKYDGNRCLAHVTRTGTELWSRSGERFYNLGTIEKALTDCFNKVYDYVNGKYGVEDYWIDGELFTTAISFNKLNGILKKKHVDMFVQADLDKMEYLVYDVILPVGYSTRHKVTQYFDCAPLKRVTYEKITATVDNLRKKLDQYLSEGHEGLMIRQDDMPYENKRTNQLIKYKDFEDDEFEIIGFKESRTGNTLGSLEFVRNDGSGITFHAALKASDPEQKYVWDNKHEFLGKKMTVEFFGYFPIEEGGKPRFPKAKGLRIDL